MESKFMFFASFIAFIVSNAGGENVSCTINCVSYTCQGIASMAEFPISLPSNMQRVTLLGTKKFYASFSDEPFKNSTWANISELSILNFIVVESIDISFLKGLQNLKFLSISSCTELRNIHHDVFNSTPNLEALYLNGNSHLQIAVVENALIGKLGKLKYLSLKGIQAFGHHVTLGTNFTKALHAKNLTYLDMSEIKVIYVENISVQEILSNIKYLSVAFSKVLFSFSMDSPSDSYFRSLEFLDLTSSEPLSKFDLKRKVESFVWLLFHNIKYLFARNVIEPDIQMSLNGSYSVENENVLQCLKVLDFSNNNVFVLNVTFSGRSDFRALETVNLSKNNLEYISPLTVSSFPSLKILDLSMNQLYKMQTMDDFSFLFSRNKDLEIISLHKNNLSVVPLNLFSSNTKLRIIDLSENELTDFKIEIHNTWDLMLIDLRKNRLKSLPAYFLGQLDQIFLRQQTANKSKSSEAHICLNHVKDISVISEKYKYGYDPGDKCMPKIEMRSIPRYITLDVLENPLMCDCDILEFFTWVLSADSNIVNISTLTCKYGNKEVLMERKVIEMIKVDCRMIYIIGFGISISVILMVSIVAFAIKIYIKHRNVRQKQDFDLLRRELLQDNKRFKFVVFLSYCSRDYEIVEKIILPSLNTFLKEAFNSQRDLVCTGDDNFVPGLRIADEIHRCINESLVIVPVITSAFLESKWSMKECIDAIDRDRKVLVLMKQNTDTSRTKEIIRNLIEQYTRASWSYNHGNFVIHPPWKSVYDALLQTAIDSFQNHRTHINGAIELVPLME